MPRLPGSKNKGKNAEPDKNLSTWVIRDVDAETRRWVRTFAAARNLTIAQALAEAVSIAREEVEREDAGFRQVSTLYVKGRPEDLPPNQLEGIIANSIRELLEVRENAERKRAGLPDLDEKWEAERNKAAKLAHELVQQHEARLRQQVQQEPDEDEQPEE